MKPGALDLGSGSPRLSVIVPGYNAAPLLADTLAALRVSDSPGVRWELIVVDDGSTDDTERVARSMADAVVRLDGPPGGPARARNAGSAAARGDWLLFIDADIRVHPDTLRRFWESTERHPNAGAVFGAYDATPQCPRLTSQYRNLLHRYFHLRGAGLAETFWAGLGGVKTGVFRQAGGFNALRYPRPQIEDIELGYRLRDAGVPIVLDPTIQGTHLKRWTLATMIVTDFRDRAVPWMRLLAERGGERTPTLNAAPSERRRVILAGLAALAGSIAIFASNLILGWVSLGLVGILIATNLPVYQWFASQRGMTFAMVVIPMHLWYYLSNAIGAAVALLAHLTTHRRGPRANRIADPGTSVGQPPP